MGVKTAVSVAVAGVAAGLVARKLVREKQDSAGDGRHPEGWKAVTVLGDPESFGTGAFPEPLQRLADVLEIRTNPAPADKGFEVHARVRDDADLADVFGDARDFVDSGKPVASICHGPWTLLEADRVRGRRLTSWPSVRTDLRNAGAEVVDEEVVTDGTLTTSRSPDDLPAFCERIVQEFAGPAHRE